MANKNKAILFGLNYSKDEKYHLDGCINDVKYMSDFLQKEFNIYSEIYTDDINQYETSHVGIIMTLNRIAIETYRDNLEFILIQFSGHGAIIKDNINGDKMNGTDEGIYPSDYEKKGLIIDDIFNKIFSLYNPKTKILFICDACHTGNIIDLKYIWDIDKKFKIDNPDSNISSKIICISACQDDQTSHDVNGFGILNNKKIYGALISTFINILQEKNNLIYNIFDLIESIRLKVISEKFSQYPNLTSSYDLNNDLFLFTENIKPTNESINYNINDLQIQEHYDIPKLKNKHLNHKIDIPINNKIDIPVIQSQHQEHYKYYTQEKSQQYRSYQQPQQYYRDNKQTTSYSYSPRQYIRYLAPTITYVPQQQYVRYTIPSVSYNYNQSSIQYYQNKSIEISQTPDYNDRYIY